MSTDSLIVEAIRQSAGSATFWEICARPGQQNSFVCGRILHAGEDYLALQGYDDSARLESVSLIEYRWIHKVSRDTPYARRLSRDAAEPLAEALHFEFPTTIREMLEALERARAIVSLVFTDEAWSVGQIERVSEEHLICASLTDSGEASGKEYLRLDRLVRVEFLGPDELNIARLMASFLPRIE